MSLRAGRYELLDTIASGGMATVHLGRAVGAGGFERLVAIKTMHPHLSNEPEFVAMFLDEARLAARIRHPNVVGTIDIQQDELGLLLVMEYIEGPSVAQLLRALNKQKTALPLDIALRIMMDILAGLHAAHELPGSGGELLNVVHRDVSPQNVLVGVDGIARIMDFGVARAESRISTTKSGDAKGKVAYMAPEQAMQKELDRRVDVYAAGLVFWELLTGKRMLRGDNDMIIMHQIFHGEHVPPHDVVPTLSPELSEVVMKSIARDRDDRHPTTAAFAEALDRVVQKLGLTVATPKTLGAFVRELNLHKSPNDILSASRPLPAPTSIRTMPSAADDGLISVKTAISTGDSSGTTSTGAESRGVFTATPSETRPAAPSRNMFVLGGVAAALVVGLGAWLIFGGTPAPETAKDTPASEGTTTGTSQQTTKDPTSATTPSASTSTATPPATGTTQTTTSKTTTNVPKTPPTQTTSKTPKGFIPKEL
jgi:eukaryotic-like serine/threonine-protein kinase